MFYNEALLEGIAVLAIKTSASVTASGTTSIGPFNAKTVNRAVFDLFVSAADATTSGFTVALQVASTSGATFVTVPTGTASPALYAPTILAGTTAAQLFRFEYSMEAVSQAMDSYTGTGTLGPWVRLLWSGATGTFTWTGVSYGVTDAYPSADVVINQYAVTTTTPVCPVANMFLNGTNLNNVPYSSTPLGNKILPY